MSSQPKDVSLDELTGREQEILQLLAEGLSDQQIGDHLFLAIGTVKWYAKSIYSKLGVHKRTAAVARARQLGLLGSNHDEIPAPLLDRNNLPHLTTSFVGREADVGAILALLADPTCRLLTLTGIGGIGKTRLAIACGAQLVNTFADGVFFVPLDSVSSPEFIPSAIADTLQLRLYGQEEVGAQLVQLLRRKKLLLILDNFEHLVAGAAFVARLVVAAPGVKVVVTSREVLNLNQEWVYPVTGLSVPESTGAADSSLVAASGAVNLFIQRAQRVRKDFIPHEELGWIGQICQIVGGMPLALELLATWLTVLTCREIVDELARNRDLLTATRRDLPERHRSIRAVFSNSWALLDGESQTVFMRLSVFRGGFTRRAAERVAEARLSHIAALVDKSFITVRDGRYQVHELLRHYAEEQLAQAPELEARARRLHSQYYAEMLRPDEGDGDDERIQPYHVWRDSDNTWAGFAYAINERDLETVALYAEGLWHHFERNGWYRVSDTVISLFRQGIATVEKDAGVHSPSYLPNLTLAWLYECLGNLTYSARQFDAAREMYQQALNYSHERSALIQARLWREIGATYAAQRSMAEANLSTYRMAETALGTQPPDDDRRWWQEWIQTQLDTAWVYYYTANVSALMGQMEKLEGIAQTYGTLIQRSTFFQTRVLLDFRRYMFRDLPDETLRFATAALNTAREAGDLRNLAWKHFNLGFTHLWRDEFDEAQVQFFHALELVSWVGDAMGAHATTLAYLPVISRRRGAVDEAERWAREGLEVATNANAPVYVAASHGHLGWVYNRRGDYAAAERECRTALEGWTQAAALPFQWIASAPLLAVSLKTGMLEEAMDCARQMLLPVQQRLLYDLSDILAEAVNAWNAGDQPLAAAHLHTFVEKGQPLGYT